MGLRLLFKRVLSKASYVKRIIKLIIDVFQTIPYAKWMNNYTKAKKRTKLRRPKKTQLCNHILITLCGYRINQHKVTATVLFCLLLQRYKMDKTTNYWESNNCTAKTQWLSTAESRKEAETRNSCPCEQTTRLENTLGKKPTPTQPRIILASTVFPMNGEFTDWLIPKTAYDINWKGLLQVLQNDTSTTASKRNYIQKHMIDLIT